MSQEEIFQLNDRANEIVKKKLDFLKCTKGCPDGPQAISLSLKADKLYCPLCETDDQDVLKVSLKACSVQVKSLLKGNSKIESYCQKIKQQIGKSFKKLRTQFDQLEELLLKKCVDFIRAGGINEIINIVKKSTFQKQNFQSAKSSKDQLKSLKGILDTNNAIKRTNIEVLEKEQSLNILEFVEKLEKQISHFYLSIRNNQLKIDQKQLGVNFRQRLLGQNDSRKVSVIREDHYRKLSEQIEGILTCQTLKVYKTSALLSSDLFTRFIDAILKIDGLQNLQIYYNQSVGLSDSEVESLLRLKDKKLRRLKLANSRQTTKRKFDIQMIPRIADRMEINVESWLA